MKAYETKKKLALSLAVAMVASSAPVLAFADTAIVAQAEAEMTVEEIIASVSAAINDPFLAAGLARIEAGEAAVATLPDGATKTALTETLQTARHMYDGLEQINQIWVALGAAGWQTNYGTEVAELQAIIAQLDAAFPGGSAFLDNFKTAVTETGLTYDAFEAMDVAAVNPTAANIAAAKEAVSKIMNPVAKTNAELRIQTEIESQELAVVSVSAINSYDAKVTFNKEVKASTVLPKNFKVTDKDGNLLFVSKAELSKDKKAVTLSFFNKFADKGVYTVETSNIEDVDGNKIATSTDQFGFVAAKVSKVEFTKTAVQQGKDLREVIKITDEAGRDVTAEQKANLEFTTSDSAIVNGGVAGVAADGTAIVTAKIKNTDVSAKAVITVAPAKAETFVGFAIDKAVDLPADTDKFTEAEEIRTYTTMSGGDSLALYFNDQYGEKMSKVTATDITNLTPNVAILNTGGTITPVSSGTAYAKVKVNNKEYTVAIEVRETGAVAEFNIEKNSIDLVTNGANGEIKLNFVDQYGSKIVPSTGVEAKSSDSTKVGVVGVTGSKLTISPVAEGTATVTVTYKGKDAAGKDIELKQEVNVNVAKSGIVSDYVAEATETNLDVYANANTDGDANVSTIKVYPVDENGKKLAAKAAGDTTLKLLDKDGKEVAGNSNSVISFNDSTDVVTAVGEGTAKVAVKVGTYTVDTITFTVVNTTPSQPNTVVFTSNGVQNVAVTGANAYDELTKMLSIKDINGDKVEIGSGKTVEVVKYDALVGNATNATVNTTSGDITVTDISKPASVDIVVKGIKLYSDAGGTTLIKEVKNLSEVIKITLDVNTEAVDQAKTAVEGATYSNVDQADVNTQALAKAEVESIIDALDLKGATYTIVEEDFTAAVAESAAGEGDGVDGSYKFKVKLTKGEATDTTTEITLTIDHTPGV